MSTLRKRFLSAGVVGILLVGEIIIINKASCSADVSAVTAGVVAVTAKETAEAVSAVEAGTQTVTINKMEAVKPVDLSKEQAYQRAAADLIFWYEDETYTQFFEKAALDYFNETGVKAAVQLVSDFDYLGAIYDETMQEGSYPDVYLLAGDSLETAYRYGIAAVNEKGISETNVAQNAVKASTYAGRLLGYPLSYNTCVFVYQNDYFETVPESLQYFIDYSNENEPAGNVEYLLEWDVNDAFYDFPFISNSVTFKKTEPKVMDIVYDEALYEKDLEYFEGLLASFSVDASTVSEDSIIVNFKSGKTLAAIIDTDSLCELSDCSYSLMQLPALNEELPAYSCAITDMLLVNDFSRNAKDAADFAYFVTNTKAAELYAQSGHFSVSISEDAEWMEQVAYDAYEAAVLAPNSEDAKDFWVKLEETISKYF